MSLREAKTPGTFAGRAYTYLAFVGGLWSAQWLLWFATGHWSLRPDPFGLALLAIVFLFWFFMPQRYWFRRGTPPKD
ncbi:hypothetical protein [Sinomonas sp. P47F7]|uniref:hypothetical protein n=1 Tax=Sinomonas sp. P47F7 TaxID=3410987 RepID=UPI003BF59CE0